MEDYEITIGTIEHYKDKACGVIKNNCERCEAGVECQGNPWCAFDIVVRFIEWDNKYNR